MIPAVMMKLIDTIETVPNARRSCVRSEYWGRRQQRMGLNTWRISVARDLDPDVVMDFAISLSNICDDVLVLLLVLTLLVLLWSPFRMC